MVTNVKLHPFDPYFCLMMTTRLDVRGAEKDTRVRLYSAGADRLSGWARRDINVVRGE